MNLRDNPFYILQLPCDASRRDIMEASDKMSFLLDSQVCNNAQNSLTNLNKRLNAEINWFIDADSIVLEEIRSRLKDNIPIRGLASLSGLNASVFNFELLVDAKTRTLETLIIDLDRQFNSLDSLQITEIINTNRLKGQVATVSVQDVEDELNSRRAEIRQSITDKLSALGEKTYIELITEMAEEYIADEYYEVGAILFDVIDQYEVRMQSVLEEKTKVIKDRIEQIKKLGNVKDVELQLSVLIDSVKEWDKIAQPLQLKSQADGMPHEISEDLGHEIRNFAIYLNNEKDMTDLALKLTSAMKGVFAELGELRELLDDDAETLEMMIERQGSKEDVEDIQEFIKLGAEILSYPTSDRIGRYLSLVRKINAMLFRLYSSGVLGYEEARKVREFVCGMARLTAIELCNKRQMVQSALKITQTLEEEFRGLDSPLMSKLREDTQQLALIRRLQDRQSSSGCCVLLGVLVFIPTAAAALASMIA